MVIDAINGPERHDPGELPVRSWSRDRIKKRLLDGTAKGVYRRPLEELGVPVKLIGLGEAYDSPFDPEAFVDALAGLTSAASLLECAEPVFKHMWLLAVISD